MAIPLEAFGEAKQGPVSDHVKCHLTPLNLLQPDTYAAGHSKAILDRWREGLCESTVSKPQQFDSRVKTLYTHRRPKECGFTLIELSIVLVIIGLVVGGIVIAKDLIGAAAVRAQISQIAKFDTAANTFRDKYGYLPGDIKDPDATRFGLQTRGSLPGEGDGNGVIQGESSGVSGGGELNGECLAFWVDLSAAHLIEGSFNPINWNGLPNLTNMDAYLPAAKLTSNYVYVWSGGSSISTVNVAGDKQNYYGISAVTSINYYQLNSTPGMSVQQAYNIDQKVDDGLPQSGRVEALYWDWNSYSFSARWAGTTGSYGPPYTSATAGSSSTCFDNSSNASGAPGIAGAAQHYSVEISNGTNANCALSFRMQAGD